jgi:polyphosphate kinase
MNRNMLRRVEVAWSVTDPLQRQRIIDECLVPYLHDDTDAWELMADGRYAPAHHDGRRSRHGAQDALMSRFSRAVVNWRQ